jgi:negative regulator of sigma E activity
MMKNITSMQRYQQAEQDPLNLRSLPLVTPREDGWTAIEQALLADRQRKSRWRVAAGSLAAAAALFLAVGALVQSPLSGPVMPGQQSDTAQTETSGSLAETPANTLDSLIALSQQLEGQLRSYRDESGNLPSDALIYQVELQDLVAQVDNELSMYPDSVDLWSQRINLMLDLAQLYETNLRREYRQMASL